jgi:ribosomal protein L37AE/L43A
LQTIPLQGTLPRCPHGVYLSDNHGSPKAPYCRGCYPDGPPFTPRELVLPRSSGDDLEAPEFRANKTTESECPKCHSRIYIRVGEEARECAECATPYPMPKRRCRGSRGSVSVQQMFDRIGRQNAE